MRQFEITLKNDKIKYYKFIALLLVLLNGAVFIFLLIADLLFYETVLSLLLLGLYLGYLLYAAKKSKNVFFINVTTFFILAGSWVILHNYLVAVACFLLGVLYDLSLQKLRFIFSENFLKKMNVPQKVYPWEMLDNVILKDNILTIDLKNNTLIQGEIESDINEVQFNEFANQHLHGDQKFSQKQI